MVSELIKSDYYNSIHTAGRQTYPWSHQKVNSCHADFENFDEFKPDAIIHDVYICLGTTRKKAGSKANFRRVDFDYVLNIGKWARKHGVEKLAVISSMGANSKSSNFYLKTKGEMEDAIARLGIPKVVIFRPSLLLGKRKEFRLMEKISIGIMTPVKYVMAGKLRKYKPVAAKTVAHAMFRYSVSAKAGITIVENEAILNIGLD